MQLTKKVTCDLNSHFQDTSKDRTCYLFQKLRFLPQTENKKASKTRVWRFFSFEHRKCVLKTFSENLPAICFLNLRKLRPRPSVCGACAERQYPDAPSGASNSRMRTWWYYMYVWERSVGPYLSMLWLPRHLLVMGPDCSFTDRVRSHLTRMPRSPLLLPSLGQSVGLQRIGSGGGIVEYYGSNGRWGLGDRVIECSRKKVIYFLHTPLLNTRVCASSPRSCLRRCVRRWCPRRCRSRLASGSLCWKRLR